jgi:hypothetical protein
MSWTIGLDIGQSQDATALAAVEHAADPDEREEYRLRHVQRFELGTSYPTVAEEVATLCRSEKLGGEVSLVVDATGVGRPIVEMLEELGLRPYSIWITGGDSVSRDGREFRVPKRELASTVQALLQAGGLRFAANLPFRDVLTDELQKFRAKINLDTGDASFEHWRERDTDDVVLALACALWYAERPSPGFVIV